ncbi:MAG: DUF4442 domain-containing protein [Cytophagales bacterium]|nr:DUF4442 domain-containing protein [Cytophagales bacterium]
METSDRSEKIRLLTNDYSPLKGAGIEVTYISPEFNTIRVSMKLTDSNKNIVNTQFGGSLYAMCDPFYMFILMEKLGDSYMVWDKEASIRFLQPGRSDVFAEFSISDQEIESIKMDLEKERSKTYEYGVKVYDSENMVVAEVRKLIYVRKMRSKDLMVYQRNSATIPKAS